MTLRPTPLPLLLCLSLATTALAQDDSNEVRELAWLKPCTFEVEETMNMHGKTLVLHHKLELLESDDGFRLVFHETAPVSLDGLDMQQIVAGGRASGRELGQTMSGAPTLYPALSLSRLGANQGADDWEGASDRLASALTRGMVAGQDLTAEDLAQIEKAAPMLRQQFLGSAEAPLLQAMAEWKLRALWHTWAELWSHLPTGDEDRTVTLIDRWGSLEFESTATVKQASDVDGMLEVKAEVMSDSPAALEAHIALIRELIESQGGDPAQTPGFDRFARSHKVEARLDPQTLRPESATLELLFELGMGERSKQDADVRSYRFIWSD